MDYEVLFLLLRDGRTVVVQAGAGVTLAMRAEERRFVLRVEGLTVFFPGFGEMMRYITNTYTGIGWPV